MPLTNLIIALASGVAVRVAFIGLHLSYPEGLWYDFEHHGFKYRIAWLLDLVTILLFGVVSGIAWYRLGSAKHPLLTVFVATGGLTLLSRLPVHKFPRTNVPGAFDDAKITLFVHLIMAVLTGAAFTGLTAIHMWWRGG